MWHQRYWKKFCHKTEGHPDPQDVHQPKYRGKKRCSKSNTTRSQKGTRSQDEIDVSAYEGEECTRSFYPIYIGNVDLQSPAHEAFTILRTRHFNPNMEGPLRIKLDTLVGGNTLPLRTYKQMFSSRPKHCALKPEPNTRLKSYSGHQIRCLGSINLAICRIN